jgi:hypothetical protein
MINEQTLLSDAKHTEICLFFFKLWHISKVSGKESPKSASPAEYGL